MSLAALHVQILRIGEFLSRMLKQQGLGHMNFTGILLYQKILHGRENFTTILVHVGLCVDPTFFYFDAFN